MSQITVISGIERRRRWNEQQKQELVVEGSAPGANTVEIARRADDRAEHICKWRQRTDRTARGFSELELQPDPVPAAASMIVVEFERAIVRIPAGASPALVSAVLRSLKS